MEQTPNRFISGINTDVLPKNRPEGFYAYALNGVIESREGDQTAIINERGNLAELTLPNGYEIIGTCLTDDNDIIIFSTNNLKSEIGIWNTDSKVYSPLIKSTCLAFSTKYPVDALFRIRKGCERVIYFTDRHNPYRSINLNSLLDYTDALTADEANSQDSWNCNSFKLNPDANVPIVELNRVLDSGGRLRVGSYQFAIQYLDEDLNPTNWFYVTRPVPIVDENLSSSYGQIHGAIPIFDNASPEEGAVPLTNKSIQLSITNLDQSYAYYRIAALHSTSTIGNVSETWVTKERPITSTDSTFTYRGPDLQSDFLGSLADIQIDRPQIETVQAHAQVDQALWLGNIKSKKYNYAEFQRRASLINVECVPKSVQVTNINNPGDPKNPRTVYDMRGFTPGEVYAFGIRYLLRDGSWTPTFHIPGRPINFNPITQSPTSIADDNTVTAPFTNHLSTAEAPRWKTGSTAEEHTTNRWLMGYYESDQAIYRDIVDCDGESIWGVDTQNNPLALKKIRHHRFPTRRQIQQYSNTTDTIQILGTEFSNISYPHEDIVGHQIMMAERLDQDKTVIDHCVILNNLYKDDTPDLIVSSGPSIYDFVGFQYVSPKSLLLQDYIQPDYLRFINKIEDTEGVQIAIDDLGDPYVISGNNTSTLAVPTPGNNWDILVNLFTFGSGDYSNLLTSNFTTNVISTVRVGPRSNQTGLGTTNKNIINTGYSNTFNYSSVDVDDIVSVSELSPVSAGSNKTVIVAALERFAQPYEAIENLVYHPIQSSYSKDEENVLTYAGDNFTFPINLMDITSVVDNGPNDIRANYFSGIWVDSEVNYSLRHPGTSSCNSIYEGEGSQALYIRSKCFDINPDNENQFVLKTDICEEYYAYNLDYSKTTLEKPGFTLGPSFDYCSSCLEEYPYRIHVSKQSYQEDQSDNYRQFLANDYLDLLGAGGPIMSLVVDKDELYAISTRNSWFIPTRPQTIQTNESLTYLGTGERLSIPAKRLATPDHSYGGTLNANSVISTEFGTIYVDADSGKVFLLGQGMEEISNRGLRNWFRENLPFKINSQFQQTLNYNFPLLDSPTFINGAGILSLYDPKHRRVIIHKRDFRIVDEYWGGDLPIYPQEDTVYWDDYNQLFVVYPQGFGSFPSVVRLDDPKYVENYSWTVSYSFPAQSWSSFHSWMPSWGFNDHKNFYTTSQDSILWKHDANEYQLFYGTKYPFIIDTTFSFNPIISSVTSNINIAAQFEKYSPSTNSYSTLEDRFFNKGIIYNSHQSTGLQTITIKDTFDTVDDTSTNILVKRADRTWRLNNIRDYVDNPDVPLFSSSWSDIQPSFPIDKVPNPAAFDYDKSLFETSRLRDYWTGLRLIYEPTKLEETPKITTDLFVAKSQYSFR